MKPWNGMAVILFGIGVVGTWYTVDTYRLSNPTERCRRSKRRRESFFLAQKAANKRQIHSDRNFIFSFHLAVPTILSFRKNYNY